MNPLVVIPTYWQARRARGTALTDRRYDHASYVGSAGTLHRCLTSLTKVNGVGRIALLVASETGAEETAATWVRKLTADFPKLRIVTVGPNEVGLIHERLEELGLGDLSAGISLTSYGAIRNVGLALAAIMGHDAVIFVDDDEVIEHQDFIERACYGLGGQTRRGVPVFVKTGVFLNREGTWRASEKDHWYDKSWKQNKLFNQYIEQAMGGARLSRANTLCGGLTAVYFEALRRVCFDPFIPRGEDLDYLINLRMYGLESWLDDQWTVRHLPPETPDPAGRFEKDAFRWIYQQRKVEFGRSQIDLLPVRPHDLDPYPGPFLEVDIERRVTTTAMMRAAANKSGDYLKVATRVRKEAAAWATENCANYFEFQYHWPEIIARIQFDDVLTQKILACESAARIELSQQLYDEARYEKATAILEPLQLIQRADTPAVADAPRLQAIAADGDPGSIIEDDESGDVYGDEAFENETFEDEGFAGEAFADDGFEDERFEDEAPQPEAPSRPKLTLVPPRPKRAPEPEPRLEDMFYDDEDDDDEDAGWFEGAEAFYDEAPDDEDDYR